MSLSSSRRGFLQGLTTLPLVGGSVGLIGVPSAVAAPVTVSLLDNYETWLRMEAHRLGIELRPNGPREQVLLYTDAWAYHRNDHQAASERAALVLAAVGCGSGLKWGRR